jgi:streptogramin lyase
VRESLPAAEARTRVVVRPAFIIGALALAGVACAGDVIGDYPSPPPPAITASPTAEAESDEGILAEIPVEGSPCFLAEAAGRVWVTSFDGNELNEIDPTTNEVVHTYAMPEEPCGMVVDHGTLWIESPSMLVRFDAERREVIDRFRIEGGVFGLASAPSGLWGLSGRDDVVLQLDPRSGRVVGRVEIEGPLTGLAVQGDAIWTISGREAIVRIDPAAHAIVERFVLESYEPEGLAIDGNTLWVSSSFEGDVLQVDARTGKVRDRITVDGSLFGGVVVGDSYWVSGSNGTIYRVDARSGELEGQVELVGFGPVPAAGNLWTVDFLTDTVFRLDEPVA